MRISFLKFLAITLVFMLGIGGFIYVIKDQEPSNRPGTSIDNEDQFIHDVNLADSLYIKLKRTDPAQQASEFSTLRFKQEETIGRMERGYDGDTVFQSLVKMTGRNYSKLLGTIAVQASDMQTREETKEQLKGQIDILKSDIQTLETQLMLKQSSLESMRAIKAVQN